MTRMARLYLLYGVGVLALLGWAEYRGWSTFRPQTERENTRTVRDNPGAYRPQYSTGGRYVGGK
ncbi:MAG TPA: hypothetical protein VFQ39_06995 [Longimicrobium sp.]|nr:hypothetical protein [Longimicrobium sp.]